MLKSLKEDLEKTVFVDKDFDNPEEFLDHYIRNLAQGYLDNFRIF